MICLWREAVEVTRLLRSSTVGNRRTSLVTRLQLRNFYADLWDVSWALMSPCAQGIQDHCRIHGFLQQRANRGCNEAKGSQHHQA